MDAPWADTIDPPHTATTVRLTGPLELRERVPVVGSFDSLHWEPDRCSFLPGGLSVVMNRVAPSPPRDQGPLSLCGIMTSRDRSSWS